MSSNWVADIIELYQQYGFHEHHLDGDLLRFRQNHLEEEMDELDKAIINKNPEAVVDAIIDLCVVAIGTLDLAGVDISKAWDEVLRSNSTKIKGMKPERPGSRGVDVVKPDGWIPPNHKDNTGKLGPAIEGIHVRNIGFSRPHGPVPSHVKTLDSYRDHALAKTHDYDDDKDPEFLHANYYPGGINDIMYEISKKVRRLRRILKRMFNGGPPPSTDSIHDSFRDISIYSAIGDTYCQGNLEGQIPNRDIFNREWLSLHERVGKYISRKEQEEKNCPEPQSYSENR